MSKLLILAAGNSSRMKKDLEGSGLDPELLAQANTMPKGMIGLGRNGRPFLDYQLYNASKGGFTEIALVINKKDTVTIPYYTELQAQKKAFGLSITFVYQELHPGREKPLGTADAVEQALQQLPHWAGSKFTVCNSDNLYSANVFTIFANCKHKASLIGYETIALGFSIEKVINCAILVSNSEGFLSNLIEKPSLEQLMANKDQNGQNFISLNIFSMEYELGLAYMESQPINIVRNEKELPEAIARMAREQKNSVFWYKVEEIIPDLTSKADIKFVQSYLLNNFTDI
jgi:glucose-1-phosphate adenylyltransferase